VRVHLTNGKQCEKHVRFPKGDPQNPLTWQELTTKFQSLAMRVSPKTRCEEIINSVKDMKPTTILRDIWKLIARSKSLSQLAD
jgi:2-methylcitrate dehydratase PrpD